MATVRKPSTAPMAPMEPIERPQTENGRFLSEYPTDGRELILNWGLDADAYNTESVKVARYVQGTQQTSLLASMPLGAFRLSAIIQRFGPGRYLIKPGPGPNSTKACTMNISEEYARAEGWREIPPMPPQQPGATDAFLQDRMMAATRGAISPIDVATMVELAVQKAIQATQQQRPAENPMDGMMKGFELAFTMMTKAKEFVNPGAAPVEAEPKTFVDVAMQYAPDILGVIKQGLGLMAANTQAQPAPQMNVQPAQPAPPKEVGPMAQEKPLPPITQQEAEAIKPVVSILHGFKNQLAGVVNDDKATPQELAAQLMGVLGADLDPSMIALSDVLKRTGPDLLQVISPDVAHEKGAAIIHECAGIIRSATEGGAEE